MKLPAYYDNWLAYNPNDRDEKYRCRFCDAEYDEPIKKCSRIELITFDGDIERCEGEIDLIEEYNHH